MALKAVFFDVDGTLVDSNDHHVAAWETVFAAIGKEIDPQAIHDQIGKGTDMLVPSLLPDVETDAIEQLGEAHGALFKSEFLPRVQPFASAHALLERVHDGGSRVVLASSASSDELDHYLDLLGAHDLVDEMVTSEDVERTKPTPDIFQKALEKVGSPPPRDVLVVGDTPYDILAARACGIDAVGLRSGGFADEALNEAGAVALYDDVAALLRDYETSPLAR